MRGCGSRCEGQGFAAHLLAAIRSFGFGCGSVMRRVLPDGGRAGDSGRITPIWLGPSTAAGPTLSIRSGNLWRQVGPCRIGPFMTTCSAENAIHPQHHRRISKGSGKSRERWPHAPGAFRQSLPAGHQPGESASGPDREHGLWLGQTHWGGDSNNLLF